MAVKAFANFPQQFVDSNGNPYSGARLFAYAAGTSTKQTFYTDSTGNTAASNPTTLNSSGYPVLSSTVFAPWGTVGVSYKFLLAPPGSDDPPASSIWTADNLTAINDISETIDQWVAFSGTPTYVSAVSFTVTGDQTSTLSVGRRLKTTNTGGTIYSTITASAYSSVTTVTVRNDSGTLDAGLSAVSYGLLTAINPSTPLLVDTFPVVSGSSDATKVLRFEVDGFTTATTRTLTPPDESGIVQLSGKSALPVPASAMIPRTTNGAAAGLTETATNDIMVSTWDFDQTTSEGVQFSIPMPSSWNEGTITFVPYWTASGGTPEQTCIFGCRAVAISNDDALDTAFGTGATSSDVLLATGDMHIGPESAAITVGGTPATSDWVVFEIYRDISDTLAADAKLISATIFITFDGKADA